MELATILTFFGAVALIQGSVTVRFSAKEKSIQDRIIDGQQAKKGQFPHQVYLRTEHAGGHGWCGGSLIHPQWVLSAAHCVEHAKYVYVLLGEIDNTVQGVSRNTSTFYIHEDFENVTFSNDLVMIDLEQPVELSDTINPIRLPEADAPDYADEACTMSGWGRTENEREPKLLSFVQMKVITNSECFVDWGKWVLKSTVCAHGLETVFQTPCHGDSGGPLAYYKAGVPTLVGVFSFVNNCCIPRISTGYVRPQYYLNWINSLIEG